MKTDAPHCESARRRTKNLLLVREACQRSGSNLNSKLPKNGKRLLWACSAAPRARLLRQTQKRLEGAARVSRP